ncbi:MAG: hypothetical protein IJU07_07170, partial [Synergistaceae bacterium]|nr:hypothetical protein [Synergistaceae bacterium]
MKIDLITLQAVNNYGSLLQAFATQIFMQNHGCDVSIINYKRQTRAENLSYRRALTDIDNRKAFINIIKRSSIKTIIKFPLLLMMAYRKKYVFEEFRKNYLNSQEKVCSSMEDFADYKSDADAFCTGSDQVWNSYWNGGVLPQLYLSFV